MSSSLKGLRAREHKRNACAEEKEKTTQTRKKTKTKEKPRHFQNGHAIFDVAGPLPWCSCKDGKFLPSCCHTKAPSTFPPRSVMVTELLSSTRRSRRYLSRRAGKKAGQEKKHTRTKLKEQQKIKKSNPRYSGRRWLSANSRPRSRRALSARRSMTEGAMSYFLTWKWM